MKTSTVFIAIGVVAIGGYAAYKIWEKNKNNQNPETEKDKVSDIILPSEEAEYSSKNESIEEIVEEYSEKKNVIQDDIVQRHDAAAKIMKESMERILLEDVKKEVSENKDTLKEIDDALDDLLDD